MADAVPRDEDHEEHSEEDSEDDSEDEGVPVSVEVLLQNFHPSMLSLLLRHGRQPRGRNLEGSATQAEIAVLGHAARAGQRFRQQVAVDCARRVALLRQYESAALPAEVMATIAEMACGVEAVAPLLCDCTEYRHVRRTLGWTEAEAAASPVLTVCARCGKICLGRCTPRVRLGDGGGAYNLSKVVVSVGAVAFKPCRHFMLEEAAGPRRGDEDVRCAVRHRMSGLHSFRTIVANEWVVRGRVTYQVVLESLRSLESPVAIGIGCVVPSCAVNCDTAWAPGTRGWAGCWGFCVEEHPSDEDDPSLHEIRALAAARATFGGQFNPAPGRPGTWVEGPDLNARSGDVLHATIDTHHLWKDVDGNRHVHRQFGLEIWRDGARVFASTLEGLEGHRDAGEPLALAVALKYANDGVRLRRVGLEGQVS